jgi:hypothetical protein
MNVLTEILSSKIRAEIFRLLFGTSAEELHMREIERRSGYCVWTWLRNEKTGTAFTIEPTRSILFIPIFGVLS